MLISINYKSYNPKTQQYLYTLVDSEFGSIEVEEKLVAARTAKGLFAAAVVKAYSERNLPVGRNLALATLYMSEKFNWSIEDTKIYQDQYCQKRIQNWAEYAKERDFHLEKLLK